MLITGVQPDFYQYEKQNKFNFCNTKSWAFSATSYEGKVALALLADPETQRLSGTSAHRRTDSVLQRLPSGSDTVGAEYGCNALLFTDAFATRFFHCHHYVKHTKN